MRSGWQTSRPELSVTIAASQMGSGEARIPVTRTDLYVDARPMCAIARLRR